MGIYISPATSEYSCTIETRTRALSTRKVTDVARFSIKLSSFFDGCGPGVTYHDGALLEQVAKAFECTKDEVFQALPSLREIQDEGEIWGMFAVVAQLGGTYFTWCANFQFCVSVRSS